MNHELDEVRIPDPSALLDPIYQKFLDFVKYVDDIVIILACCSTGNKNRLSSTTCGEELQKIGKDLQSFKGLCQKDPKKLPILSN